jgi:hypothetical protein
MNEKKIKHLELIQAIINRLANSSFLIKGWCVTLVAAILALANKDMNRGFIVIVLVPIVLFWCLDAYFLNLEKLFRELYNKVRVKNEEDIDFSMNASKSNSFKKFFKTVFSVTLLTFYGFMFIAAILAVALLFNWIDLRAK